jgi:hypothetical protein
MLHPKFWGIPSHKNRQDRCHKTGKNVFEHSVESFSCFAEPNKFQKNGIQLNFGLVLFLLHTRHPFFEAFSLTDFREVQTECSPPLVPVGKQNRNRIPALHQSRMTAAPVRRAAAPPASTPQPAALLQWCTQAMQDRCMRFVCVSLALQVDSRAAFASALARNSLVGNCAAATYVDRAHCRTTQSHLGAKGPMMSHLRST